MCTCIRKVVTATAALLALPLRLPPSAGRPQTPPTCNANLLDVTISRDTPAARPGEIVNYTVNIINRSVLGVQIGCNALDVTADFFCPGPTGQSNGASTNLITNVDIPA